MFRPCMGCRTRRGLSDEREGPFGGEGRWEGNWTHGRFDCAFPVEDTGIIICNGETLGGTCERQVSGWTTLCARTCLDGVALEIAQFLGCGITVSTIAPGSGDGLGAGRPSEYVWDTKIAGVSTARMERSGFGRQTLTRP